MYLIPMQEKRSRRTFERLEEYYLLTLELSPWPFQKLAPQVETPASLSNS